MKNWSPLIIGTLFLALAVWLGFYFMFPDYPLTAGETVLIVLASAVAAFVVKWIREKTGKGGKDA